MRELKINGVYRHMLIFLIGITICLKNVFVIRKKELNK